MIEELNSKIMLSGGVIGDQDKEKFLEMKEAFEANRKAIQDEGNIIFNI